MLTKTKDSDDHEQPDKSDKKSKKTTSQEAMETISRPDGPTKSQIGPAKFSILTVPLQNMPGSPLVINAFSAKARATMREAQELGPQAKKMRVKNAKDFNAAYQNARHISRDGWDGAAAATFRNAMISACRLVGFKMVMAKLALFIEPDGVSAADGMPLVRIFGEPEVFEASVRNASGVADIRVRPRWDEWSANLRVRFDSDLFTDEDIVNLLVRAGAQSGICEGRPSSSGSFGQGWGLFQIDTSKSIELHEVEAPKIEFKRMR